MNTTAAWKTGAGVNPRFRDMRGGCDSGTGQRPQGAATGGLVNAYRSGVAGTLIRVPATAAHVGALRAPGVVPGYYLSILVILLPWIPTPAISPVWPKMSA